MRILLIDDDLGLTQLLQLVFESKRFDVTVAYTGAQALELVETERPEAIVLDLVMPDMDGAEICRHIRTNPHTAHIPIIVLTAKPGQQARQTALDAGATKYLIKPIKPSELMAYISEVVARPAPSLI